VSEQLTNLERAVLDKMLSGDNSELKILRGQLAKITVSIREMTGSGFFATFEIPAGVPRLKKNGRVTISDISLNLPKLKHGAGFVLFIDDGALGCLEAFCYDESWPDSIADFELSYLKESPRGSGKLIPSDERDYDFALKDFAT
jgi:hypothetical protein